NDLSPVLAVADSPVKLRGGSGNVVAHVRGPLASPRITGNLSLTHFAVGDRPPFDRGSADFDAGASGASLQNGLLVRNVSQVQFSASFVRSNWIPEPDQSLRVNAKVQQVDL